MRRKWRHIVCSLVWVGVLVGCGRITRPVEPFVYQFSPGQSYRYRFRVESQLSLEAGLLGYQGTVVVSGVMDFMPVAFTNGEYLFHLVIRDVVVDNAERTIAGGILGYINYLGSTFYEWYMSPQGRITVYYKNLPLYPLQWLANMVIVDVSNWDELRDRGEQRATNFSAMFQNQSLTVESSLFQRLVGVQGDEYRVGQDYTYMAYQEKAFPMATVDIHMETILSTRTHRFTSKQGTFQFMGRVPFVTQGIFSLSASFQGIGQFLLEEESLP